LLGPGAPARHVGTAPALRVGTWPTSSKITAPTAEILASVHRRVLYCRTIMTVERADGRSTTELRPVRFNRGWSDHAEGSVLVEFGGTRVLCTASFTQGVPRWRKGSGRGWVTAEYAMLPRSTNTRSDRESVKGRLGGRTHEISRLIGRSLRAIVDTSALG